MTSDGAAEGDRWRYEQEEYEINSPACRRIDLFGALAVLAVVVAPLIYFGVSNLVGVK